MKFLNNVDINKNQAISLGLEISSSHPASPVAGQVYFNTSDSLVYVYNGVSWNTMSEQCKYTTTGKNVSNNYYYLNYDTGDDSNDGRSELTAVKTFARLNEIIPLILEDDTYVYVEGDLTGIEVLIENHHVVAGKFFEVYFYTTSGALRYNFFNLTGTGYFYAYPILISASSNGNVSIEGCSNFSLSGIEKNNQLYLTSPFVFVKKSVGVSLNYIKYPANIDYIVSVDSSIVTMNGSPSYAGKTTAKYLAKLMNRSIIFENVTPTNVLPVPGIEKYNIDKKGESLSVPDLITTFNIDGGTPTSVYTVEQNINGGGV